MSEEKDLSGFEKDNPPFELEPKEFVIDVTEESERG
jgi:hypothetical protein